MKIHERNLGDVMVLELDGRFILGEEALFRRLVDAGIERGTRKLLINLSLVHYMDSSGLGELIRGYMSMKQVDGQMKLLRGSDRLNQLLVLTKLITVFETFDSEALAVSSFAANQRTEIPLGNPFLP